MSEPERCRSCGAPVVFVTTESVKKMPIDVKPAPNGNLVKTGARSVRYVSKERPAAPGQARFVSHFSTCPESKEWRKSA